MTSPDIDSSLVRQVIVALILVATLSGLTAVAADGIPNDGTSTEREHSYDANRNKVNGSQTGSSCDGGGCLPPEGVRCSHRALPRGGSFQLHCHGPGPTPNPPEKETGT